MNLDNAVLTAIISAIVITVPAVFAFITQRRKDKKDLAAQAQQAVADVITTLRQQMSELKADLDEEREDRKRVEDAREAAEAARQDVVRELAEQTKKNTDAAAVIATLRNQIAGLAQIQLRRDAEVKERAAERERASVENREKIEVLEARIAELSKSPAAEKVRALEARIAALGKELEDCFGKLPEEDKS